jgi:hypothetical protein
VGTPVSTTGLLTSINATATCPAGTVLLGGGYRLSGPGILLIQVSDNSRDSGNPNQWNVTAFGPLALLNTVTAVAECTI